MTEDYTTWTDEALRDLATAVTTEQERRRVLREAEERLAKIVDEVEAAMEGNAPVAWETLTDRVAPGQRVIWTDGNVWRNRSKAWLPTTATPETYPLGWAQETGLPDKIPEWTDVGPPTYTAGDLVTDRGAGWRPSTTPSLWTPRG